MVLLSPPQLPLAVRYLKETLQYSFPEAAARAAAAEAEARAREERQRAALRARLAALLAGEWREGLGTARELLREIGECFALLEEQQAAAAGGAGGQQRGAATASADAAADGLEWEDVGAAEAAAGGPPQEGLSAYALADGAALATAVGAGDGGGGGAAGEQRDPVVLETLAGLYRQLTSRTLPQVQVGKGGSGRWVGAWLGLPGDTC